MTPTPDDPVLPLLDAALSTLDTYRGRSAKTKALVATWRLNDAARIIAALPAVGLVLTTKHAPDPADAVVEAARTAMAALDTVDSDRHVRERLRAALAAYDARAVEPARRKV